MKEDKGINRLISTKAGKKLIMILTAVIIILLVSFGINMIVHLNKEGRSSDASDTLSDAYTSETSTIVIPTSPGPLAPTQSGTNTPSTAAVVTVTPLSNPSPTVKPIEHLDLYNDFGWINTSDIFKGFIISEKWVNGEPYYRLYNEKKDIEILVDHTQQNAKILYDGKSMNYDMQFLMAAGGSASIDFLDITGDSEEELIICHSGGGTGFCEGTCDVIDLTAMTKYIIDDYINNLCSKVKVEPLKEIHGHQILCKVTDSNGNIYYGMINAAYSDDPQYYSFKPENYANYYSIGVNYDKHCLEVSIGIDMDNNGNCYLGNISSYMVYEKSKKRFVLSDEYTVNMNSITDGYYYDSSTSETVETPKEQLLDNIIAINYKYNDYMIESFADDFNGDGQQEFFYIFTYPGTYKGDHNNYGADIWFGNSDGVRKVLENDYINPNTYGCIEVAGRKYFRYDIAYVTSSTTRLLEVRNNQCREYFTACGSINFIKDNNDFTVLYDCYDMFYDKQEKYLLGHTWKNYFYYADAKGFHEYGAIEISQEEFLKYQNAESILKDIDNKYGEDEKINLHFFKRSNGLIHINISSEDDERISYYYKTYRINGNNLEEFNDGEGNYMDALTPEIAVY